MCIYPEGPESVVEVEDDEFGEGVGVCEGRWWGDGAGGWRGGFQELLTHGAEVVVDGTHREDREEAEDDTKQITKTSRRHGSTQENCLLKELGFPGELYIYVYIYIEQRRGVRPRKKLRSDVAKTPGRRSVEPGKNAMAAYVHCKWCIVTQKKKRRVRKKWRKGSTMQTSVTKL